MSCKLKFVKTVIDRNGKTWNLYLDKADVEYLENMRKKMHESSEKVTIDEVMLKRFNIRKEKNANS